MEEKELTEFEWEMRELQQLMDPENYVPCISSAELMDQEFTPAEFVVKGFLPKGLCVLGGAPKIGKSWMMLDLCLHVAKGEPFLGMEVKQGTAWYLSLEDTNDRIKQRLACITADAVDNFQITTREHEPGTMVDGLPKTIDKFMRKFPDTKLIVIDTMQMAKGTSKDPQYSGDYADTGAFKTIADKHKVAMVLITHLRKAADSDTFNEITGSTGITGAADTLMTLKKSARMADAAKLSCIGRDIAQREMELRFDKTNFVWNKISDSAELEPRMIKLQEDIVLLSAQAEPKEVVDYREKITVLQYALEQYTNRDEGQDVPESVIEAFVTKIVVSQDGFDWYLRFDGDPDDPLHCKIEGKRKTTTKIVVAGANSPAIHRSATGRYQGLRFHPITNPR